MKCYKRLGNDEKIEVAVLYNSGFGSGWSTEMNIIADKYLLCLDNRIVALFLSQSRNCTNKCSDAEKIEQLNKLFKKMWDEFDPHDHQTLKMLTSGISHAWLDLKIEWVPYGSKFAINAYDGQEIVWFDEKMTMAANDDTAVKLAVKVPGTDDSFFYKIVENPSKENVAHNLNAKVLNTDKDDVDKFLFTSEERKKYKISCIKPVAINTEHSKQVGFRVFETENYISIWDDDKLLFSYGSRGQKPEPFTYKQLTNEFKTGNIIQKLIDIFGEEKVWDLCRPA